SLVRGGQPAAQAPGSLLQAASDRQYVQGLTLRALHSLMFTEEVALVSLPDATHAAWSFAAVESRPVLSGVAPRTGPAGGGTRVTLVGDGFRSRETTVTFGGTDAPRVQVIDPRVLLCDAPAASGPGPVEVSVRTQDGRSALPGAFSYET